MNDFIMMPIPAAMFTSVCALLGGAAASTLTGASARAAPPASAAAGLPVVQKEDPASQKQDSAPAGEVDKGGHPWSPDLHASTKTKTKEGYWRMKVGVTRPADLPGFPKDPASTGATGTSNAGTGSAATGSVTGGNAGPGTDEDEDEFAAFRAAAEKTSATNAAAAAAVPARQWTDSDLASLANQAAQKLGDPQPVKDIIAAYVPEGQVPHSRNIPADKRAAFAQAVEQKAGITFAG